MRIGAWVVWVLLAMGSLAVFGPTEYVFADGFGGADARYMAEDARAGPTLTIEASKTSVVWSDVDRMVETARAGPTLAIENAQFSVVWSSVDRNETMKHRLCVSTAGRKTIGWLVVAHRNGPLLTF